MCLVSAENLEKSLRQMEKQLLQLEKDLDTFSSTDDQKDLFHSKMAISFHTFACAPTLYIFVSLFFCLNTFTHCCQHCYFFCAWFSSTLQPHTLSQTLIRVYVCVCELIIYIELHRAACETEDSLIMESYIPVLAC